MRHIYGLCRTLYVVLSLAVVLVVWGCAPPPVRYPPRPPVTSPSPQSPGQPTPPASRPSASQPSPSMLASAQWVTEARQAVEAGDYDRAVVLLERAISVEPNNGRAFYYYGLVLGERGEAQQALRHLRKAEILLRGDHGSLGNVYAQMGLNLERLGRRAEAIQRYEQAQTHDPGNPIARRRLQALRG